MKNPRPVIQRHPFGCGAACTAFVLGISYLRTLKLFRNGKSKAQKRGFYCREVIKVLNKKGLDFEYKYVKNRIRKKIYRDYSIVFIRRSEKYPAGHYLCRYKNLWMDSWVNFQENLNIKKAKAGFRKKLPGRAIYAILPK